jgi:hypothetical protein
MTFADLKTAHPIEEIVARYVELRPSGSNLVARCPFHDDQGRPNLVVFLRTQTWKCFACGAMGDILDFVARIEDVPTAEAARRIQNMHQAERREPPATRTLRAPDVVIDRVYRALIAQLGLSEEHRAALLHRGLSPEAVMEAGYRSLPVSGRDRVVEDLLRRGVDLGGVPGFARPRKGGNWRLYGQPGLLIPVRDLHGAILGCQVRSDQNASSRYRWLSTPDTERRAGGASSGAPCHVAGRGFLDGRLWITEGPLKADVTSHRLSVPVLGVAGVANWRKAVPLVRETGAERIILAFDQDEREETRKAVERNLAEFREALQAMQVRVLTASWKEGKGIDDALALGKSVKVS